MESQESLVPQAAPWQANPRRRVPPEGRPRPAPRRTRSSSPRGFHPSSATSSIRERYRQRPGSPPVTRLPPALQTTPKNRHPRPPSPAVLIRRSQSPSPSPHTSSVPRHSQLPHEGQRSLSRSPPRPSNQRQKPVNRSPGGDYALKVGKDHRQQKRLANRYTETKKACDECVNKHRPCTFQLAPDQCDHCFKRGLRCLIKDKRVQPVGPKSGPPRREGQGHRRGDKDDERDQDRRGQAGRPFNRVGEGCGELFVS